MSVPQNYSDLLKDAIIDTFVPSVSDLDIEEALGQLSDDEAPNLSDVLPSIPQRQLLFFGTSLASGYEFGFSFSQIKSCPICYV
jgi:hypothetical protein